MVRGTRRVLAALALGLAVLWAGCGRGGEGPSPTPGPGAGELVLYSGRAESLVGPLIERFQRDTGIRVQVRYGESAALALALLEEGRRSPADVFFTVDPTGTGALARAGLLRPLPAHLLDRVDPRFRARDGRWVGTSGRVRVVAYNPTRVREGELPASVLGFTDPRWRGRVGWTPTYGSFHAFVTALRVVHGEDVARRWVEGMVRNRTRSYPTNVPMVEAVAAGEIDVALTNHYYVYRLRAERGPDVPVRAHFFRNGDVGGLIIPATAGILASAPHPEAAERFLAFLLSEPAQRYFAEQTLEYPLVPGVPPAPGLPPLSSLPQPELDLGALHDLQRTLDLLRDAGAL